MESKQLSQKLLDSVNSHISPSDKLAMISTTDSISSEDDNLILDNSKIK